MNILLEIINFDNILHINNKVHLIFYFSLVLRNVLYPKKLKKIYLIDVNKITEKQPVHIYLISFSWKFKYEFAIASEPFSNSLLVD